MSSPFGQRHTLPGIRPAVCCCSLSDLKCGTVKSTKAITRALFLVFVRSSSMYPVSPFTTVLHMCITPLSKSMSCQRKPQTSERRKPYTIDSSIAVYIGLPAASAAERSFLACSTVKVLPLNLSLARGILTSVAGLLLIIPSRIASSKTPLIRVKCFPIVSGFKLSAIVSQYHCNLPYVIFFILGLVCMS